MGRTKEEMKQARKLLKKPAGKLMPVDLSCFDPPAWITRVYKNNRYVIMINDCALMTGGVIAIRALIQRHDDRPIPNHWHELQTIKNELFGPETTAIEYYPAESALEDEANIYWIWILPNDKLPKRL